MQCAIQTGSGQSLAAEQVDAVRAQCDRLFGGVLVADQGQIDLFPEGARQGDELAGARI